MKLISPRRLQVTDEPMFIHQERVLSIVWVALAYFALLTWRLRGRTAGRWIFGIRVVKLDGTPLGLWDSFGRAGGYSASFATLGLGFLEAFWHPNRQTVHDRVSSTVVIRGRQDPLGILEDSVTTLPTESKSLPE